MPNEAFGILEVARRSWNHDIRSLIGGNILTLNPSHDLMI